MKQLLSRIALLVFCLMPLLAYLSVLTAHAQAQNIVLKREDTTGHVTIIVLDMSGSMHENDPDGVRCSAANAYIDLSGPGDLVGLVGLDGNGDRGGPHAFQLAQEWAPPTHMDTTPEREALKQLIAARSKGCTPDQSTPTYDALNKALRMLASATESGKQGSVILLTDGLPDPDSSAQIEAINNELLPQFQLHAWPIDTIALGTGTDFSFLKNLSNRTEGVAYSDVKDGVASPLNIAPFFVDIFGLRNHRTLGPTVAPTALYGQAASYEFQLGDYVDHLDVIAVKQDAGARITLTSPPPGAKTLPPEVPGTFVSTSDAHYAIFSIDSPQPGRWQLNVSGTGQFLMDSVVTSSLQVVIDSPAANSTLPLGQTFTLIADVVNGKGTRVQDTYSLAALIAGGIDAPKQLTLRYDAQYDKYIAEISIPESQAPGSYIITVSASAISGAAISSTRQVVQMDHFPVPLFSSTNSTVAQWDPVMQALYSPPIGVVQWLGVLPLGDSPAEPAAAFSGQVELQGKPYNDAAVSTTVSPIGSSTQTPVRVFNDGKGHFHILFPPLLAGDYLVTFRTSGTFKGVHDFGTITHIVHLYMRPTTPLQEIRAWSVTFLLYPALALLFVLLIRYSTLPPPNEKYKIRGDLSTRWMKKRRGAIQRLRRRNRLYSAKALLPSYRGLELLVNYDRKGGVKVRARGREGENWFRTSTARVSRSFERLPEVFYHPSGEPNDKEAVIYIFNPPGMADRGKGAPGGPTDQGAASNAMPGRAGSDRSISGASHRPPTGRLPGTGGRKPRGGAPPKRRGI